jgi:hypothetical protein
MNMLDISEAPPAAVGSVMGHNAPPLAERLKDDHAPLVDEVEGLAIVANALPKAIETDEDLSKLGKVVISARATAAKLESARKAEKEPFLVAGRAVDGFFGDMCERVNRIAKALQSRADAYQAEKAAKARAEADRLRRIAEEEARVARAEAERQRRIAEEAEAKNRATMAAKHEEKSQIADLKATVAETAALAAAATADAKAADLTRVRSEGVLVSSKAPWTFQIEKLGEIDLEVLRPYFAVGDIEKAIRGAIRGGQREIKGLRIYQETKASFR